MCNLPEAAWSQRRRTEAQAGASEVPLSPAHPAPPLVARGYSGGAVRPFSEGERVFPSPPRLGCFAKPTSESSLGLHFAGT